MTEPEEIRLLDSASRRRVATVLVMLALFSEIVPFQYSMGGAIVPLVGRSFPSSGNSITWMITIIGVVGGGTMALVTRFADVWGRKRVLLGCSIAFLAGTIVCAVTTSWAVFLTGRGLEAVALGMSPLCYTLIRDIFPRSWVAVSIGIVGTGLGMSAIAGPLIAGALTEHYSWRSIFWFLAVYMAVVIPLFAMMVPESPRRQRVRVDYLGGLLLGIGIAGVLIYASEGQDWGWFKATSAGYLIGGLVALVLFVLVETRVQNPVLQLRLLRSPRVVLAVVAYIFGTMAIAVPAFAAPYMFEIDISSVKNSIIAGAAAQNHVSASLVAQFVSFRGDMAYAHGYTIIQLAFRVLLWSSVTAMIFGPIGGLWARSRGPRPVLLAGAACMLVSSVGLYYRHDTWTAQAVFGVIGGMAFGFFYASLPNLVMEAVTTDEQATSAGLTTSFGAVGAAFATAFATTVLVHYPFQMVASPPGAPKIVTNIPQLYTNQGFGQVYLLVGGIGGLMTLLAAVAFFFTQRADPEAL